MTKEIIEIVNAYRKAREEGRQTALATVVRVEGSSYRRPGARMLLEDNGRLTGAISGGCLEGDAYRKAMLAINQGRNKLVTYNSNDEDDLQFGVQLGCNGIVHILFEPIDPGREDHPLALLEKFCQGGKDAAMVTMFSMENNTANHPGTTFYFDGQQVSGLTGNADLDKQLEEDAKLAWLQKASFQNQYKAFEWTAFVEYLEPPVSLHIVGAGNDAMPLVEMASVLGWQIILVDGRATHANLQRFPKAKKILTGRPDDAIKELAIDDRSVFVLMTHNYHYDLAMLRLLLETDCPYIGTLGPRSRLDRMLTELEIQGKEITTEQKARIYGPTGLDIGSEGAEEIALAVLAEIKAVLSERQGRFLREKADEIHSRSLQQSGKHRRSLEVE